MRAYIFKQKNILIISLRINSQLIITLEMRGIVRALNQTAQYVRYNRYNSTAKIRYTYLLAMK